MLSNNSTIEPLGEAWIHHYISRERTEGAEEYRPWAYGSIYNRQRLAEVCAWSVERHAGDVLEIGVYVGATSLVLAPSCAKYRRQLLLIDPWEEGTTGVDSSTFPEITAQNLKPFGDTVQILQMRSQDPKAIELMRSHQFAFAYIDGSHLAKDLAVDLHTVLPLTTGVVGIDDWFLPEVCQTVREIAPQYGWSILQFPEFREAYLKRG